MLISTSRGGFKGSTPKRFMENKDAIHIEVYLHKINVLSLKSVINRQKKNQRNVEA